MRSALAWLASDLGELWIWLRWRVRGPRRLPPDGLTIAQAEARIRHRRFETAYVFDQTGRQLFRQEGNEDGVHFAAADLPLLRDAVVIHNHPPHREYSVTDPRYDGGAVSRTDLDLALVWNFAEVRVVSTFWRFVAMRPGSEWPVDADTMSEYYHEMAREVMQDFTAAVELGEMTDAEAEGAASDEVVARLARKVGFHYAREPR